MRRIALFLQFTNILAVLIPGLINLTWSCPNPEFSVPVQVFENLKTIVPRRLSQVCAIPTDQHITENVLILPPKSLCRSLNPEYRILMSGGFSNPCQSVLKTFETQITAICKVSAYVGEVLGGLRYAFQTRNNWTLPVVGTGVVGINTILMNLLEPGDSILIGLNGHWANTAAIISRNLGAKVITLNKTAGQTFTLQELTSAVEKHKPNILYLVHGESSTGVLQNLTGVGQMCRKYATL